MCVVETDKVTVDIRAPQSGVLKEILANNGAEVSIGAPLYVLSPSDNATNTTNATADTNKVVENKENKATVKETTEVKPTAETKETVIVLPPLGDSVSSGVIKHFNKKSGDNVAMDEIICIVETDKVTVDIRAPQSGVFLEGLVKEGAELKIGAPLYKLGSGTGNVNVKVETKTTSSTATNTNKTTTTPPPPTTTTTTSPPKTTASTTSNTAPVVSTKGINDRSETRVKMSKMRQRIAQRLKESQNTSAMLTTFQEVDMSNIFEMRNKYKDQFEKLHKVKLGFMSAFVKASACALQEIPAVNGVIDDKTNEIIYRNYVDISVAVASPTGLVVPVLRNCENMNFADVEKAINYFGNKAKDGSITLEDMLGGTFTISNGGTFGSLFGTPIINPPQSAILGMHATKMRAVVNSNNVVVAKPMMYLALTYDHRLIDGREAVTFLKSIQNKVEDPTRMLLDL